MTIEPKKLPTLLLITTSPIVEDFFDKMVGKMEGYALIVTPSILELFEYLDKTYISCIVIDENATGGQLQSTCRSIKQLKEYRYTPLLIITNHLKKTFTKALIQEGASDFLRQPLDEDEFMVRLDLAIHAGKTQAKVANLAPYFAGEKMEGLRLENKPLLGSCAYQMIQSALQKGGGFALILLKIDPYEEIVQMRGKTSADALCREYEKRVQKLVRVQDVLSAQQGGTFAIFLPKTSARAARFIAENILEGLEGEVFAAEGNPLIVTSSVGFATLSEVGDRAKSATVNLQRLLKEATASLQKPADKKFRR